MTWNGIIQKTASCDTTGIIMVDSQIQNIKHIKPSAHYNPSGIIHSKQPKISGTCQKWLKTDHTSKTAKTGFAKNDTSRNTVLNKKQAQNSRSSSSTSHRDSYITAYTPYTAILIESFKKLDKWEIDLIIHIGCN